MSDKKLLNRIDNIHGVDERTRGIISAVTNDGRHERRRHIKEKAQKVLDKYFDRLAEIFLFAEDEDARSMARAGFDELAKSYSLNLAEQLVREERMTAYRDSEAASAKASAAISEAKSADMDFALTLAGEICSERKGSAVWSRSDLAKEIKRQWDAESPPARSERTIRGYLDEVDFAHESLRIRKTRKSSKTSLESQKNAWPSFSKSNPPR